MTRKTQSEKSSTIPAIRPDKAIEELFAARDHSRPGSEEEENAAKNILARIFPDTDARQVTDRKFQPLR